MTLAALIALLLLQLKHVIFDFVLQTQYQARNKGTYGHPGGLAHAGLHAAGTALVLLAFRIQLPLVLAIVVAEFLIHYHADWGKEQLVRRFAPHPGKRYWLIFGMDQFVHHATYAAIVFSAVPD